MTISGVKTTYNWTYLNGTNTTPPPPPQQQALSHGQQLSEVASPLNFTVKSYGF